MNCLICKRPMRPSGATLGEHPGTVAHAGRGLCWTHYKRARRAGFEGFPELHRSELDWSEPGRSDRPLVEADPDSYTVATLAAYLAGRRDRLARLERVIPRRRVVAA